MHSELLVERFKPTLGRWWGVAGLAMVAFVVVAVVSSGIDAAALAIAAGAALLGWATYAALVRPTVHAYEDHLLLRNALTDVRLPWGEISDVDVRQTLCVYTGMNRHHGIAVGKSARYLIRGEKRGQSLMSTPQEERFASKPTMTGSDVTGMHYADYVQIRIESLAREQTKNGGLGHVERRWAWPTVGVGIAIVLAFVAFVVVANL